MRVKRLEIQGFKSFKDKTVIHFDHGITGIVGPNGCGKSNIVDAFFWVMGEQSYKHMRGSGSEDLIFNGSSKYSPLGMAEATMVMETDVIDPDALPSGATATDVPIHLKTKEISVTRRLYRGGEGEYFINGVTARLKDIQELFMDTGVGAKGYSVIEQGQIGKIVNAKPEERRLLIEEAAGIAKYKARKKESLRKIEATQTNMSRLNDVIQEIERNLGSLERQAQKARLYKKYKDELLDKEMTWGRRKSQVLRQKLEGILQHKQALEQELVGLRAELQTAENAIEVDRIEQLHNTKLAEELQTKLQQLSDELTREQSALDLSRRRQGDLSSQLSALDSEKQQLEESIEVERERLAGHEAEVEDSGRVFQEAAHKVQKQDELVRRLRQEAQATRQQLEATKRDLMNGVTQSSDLPSRAASLLSRTESAHAQVERLLQQSQQLGERIAETREESEKTLSIFEELKRKRERLKGELDEQTALLRENDSAIRELADGREEAMNRTLQLKSKLQSLEELAAAYEGLADGPKAALEWARNNGKSKQLLTLADTLEVKEGFDSAIQGWLESRLESLLAEDASIASEALSQIRENKQGRVAIQVGGTNPSLKGAFKQVCDLLDNAGFEIVGELSEFAKINTALSKGLQEMAGAIIANVVVVRSFDQIAKFIEEGGALNLGIWSMVSMDGSTLDIVESGYVMRGGSTENDSSAMLITRKRAITSLQEEVLEAEQLQGEAEALYTTAHGKLEQIRSTCQSLQTELQEVQVQTAGYERDVHQNARTQRDLEQQLRNLESEMDEARSEELRAREERAKIEDRLNEITAARGALEAAIEAGETELVTRDSEVQVQEGAQQTLRVEEASIRERATSLKRELETGRTVVSDRQRRLADIQRTLERATQEKEQFTGGEEELAVKIEELSLALASGRGDLAVVKNRIETASAKVNAALDLIKELHKTGDEKSTNANQIALEVEKLSSDLSHLVQNLEEKYGQGCLDQTTIVPVQEEMTEPVITAEMTAEEEQALGQEVEWLRDRIRKLGEVNVMAIEEYEELKVRYDSLLTEKADLDKSLENLQAAIEHINKTSEERFRKAFEAIADRFKRLFPIIFGGGYAELSLVYPEGSHDILEAGVDILAQPPGKKIVNIGLLSGGEKALTAVSLIFAIFMVKPSPFCVLDEVDAPLDDANIGKFNALLREMAAKSQFILITHNKKTMELNDTLYGVTMEEPGVSKMISIEMR